MKRGGDRLRKLSPPGLLWMCLGSREAGRDVLVAAQRLCVHSVALKGAHREAEVCAVVPRFITCSRTEISLTLWQGEVLLCSSAEAFVKSGRRCQSL